MDLRHQSSAMCIIMLGGEDTHPWSATKVGNPIPATIPVTKRNNQQTGKKTNKRGTGITSKSPPGITSKGITSKSEMNENNV